MEVPTDAKCPKCGEPVSLDLFTQLMDSSRVRFVLHPHAGELMSADTIGGSITNMHKLLVEAGKAVGVKTNVVVEGLEYDAGSVTVKLLVTRSESKIKKRADERT